MFFWCTPFFVSSPSGFAMDTGSQVNVLLSPSELLAILILPGVLSFFFILGNPPLQSQLTPHQPGSDKPKGGSARKILVVSCPVRIEIYRRTQVPACFLSQKKKIQIHRRKKPRIFESLKFEC